MILTDADDRKRTSTEVNPPSYAPAMDFVEVVRCKDCKYYDPPFEVDGKRFEGDCNFHEWYRAEPKENDFCSKGERKDV